MITNVKAIYNDMTVDCVLLAKFDIEVNSFKSKQKRFLFFKRNKVVECVDYKSVCLVFIPWKHKSKELAFISEELVLGNSDFLDKTNIIKIAEFNSECVEYYFEDKLITSELVVKNFEGYDFIYQNNFFLSSLYLCESEQCYNLLYEKLPEVFNCEPIDDGVQLETMFVDSTKRKGSDYIEFQFANNTKKPFKKIDNFKNDSLYVRSDDINCFLEVYGGLFENCISQDNSGRFDVFSVNYYTLDTTKSIFARLKKSDILGSERLIVWLNKVIESGAGFYILGI